MAWIVRLVSIGAEGEEHSTDVMRIAKPDTLADLSTLDLLQKSGGFLMRQRELHDAAETVHQGV